MGPSAWLLRDLGGQAVATTESTALSGPGYIRLEPCINGNVSPSGLFASPELEAAARALAKGRLTDAPKGSHDVSAVLEGRTRAID